MWLGESGALADAKPGAVVVECATLSFEWVREWHALAHARKMLAMDAPLFGSKLAAAGGTVNLYIGAEPETLETALPVLKAFAGNVICLGPPTSGAIYKLINKPRSKCMNYRRLVTISKPKNSCKELRFLAEKSMPKSVLR